jgi:hypothetical protein
MNANNFSFFESSTKPIPDIDVLSSPVIDEVTETIDVVVPFPGEVDVHDDDTADMISVFLEEDFITDKEVELPIVLPQPQPLRFRTRCLLIVEDKTATTMGAEAGLQILNRVRGLI